MSTVDDCTNRSNQEPIGVSLGDHFNSTTSVSSGDLTHLKQEKIHGPLTDESVGKQSNTKDTQECLSEHLDDIDGVFTKFFNKGQYCPREEEVKIWGPSVGNFPPSDADQKEELLYLLLKSTDAVRWRQCLVVMCDRCQTEDDWRKLLAYLISVIRVVGRRVQSEPNSECPLFIKSTPSQVRQDDLIDFLKSVEFHVKHTQIDDEPVLSISAEEPYSPETASGILHLLDSLLYLPFHVASELMRLGFEQGTQLFQTLMRLSGGTGMTNEMVSLMQDFTSQHANVMAACGFRWSIESALAWEKPTLDQTLQMYDAVFTALYCMFGNTGDIQTAI